MWRQLVGREPCRHRCAPAAERRKTTERLLSRARFPIPNGNLSSSGCRVRGRPPPACGSTLTAALAAGSPGLLLQPHGFDGLLPGQIGLAPDYLVVSELAMNRPGLGEIYLGGSPAHIDPAKPQTESPRSRSSLSESWNTSHVSHALANQRVISSWPRYTVRSTAAAPAGTYSAPGAK
jgi:hypothetical protein